MPELEKVYEPGRQAGARHGRQTGSVGNQESHLTTWSVVTTSVQVSTPWAGVVITANTAVHGCLWVSHDRKMTADRPTEPRRLRPFGLRLRRGLGRSAASSFLYWVTHSQL